MAGPGRSVLESVLLSLAVTTVGQLSPIVKRIMRRGMPAPGRSNENDGMCLGVDRASPRWTAKCSAVTDEDTNESRVRSFKCVPWGLRKWRITVGHLVDSLRITSILI
jgi:hypothetical protein